MRYFSTIVQCSKSARCGHGDAASCRRDGGSPSAEVGWAGLCPPHSRAVPPLAGRRAAASTMVVAGAGAPPADRRWKRRHPRRGGTPSSARQPHLRGLPNFMVKRRDCSAVIRECLWRTLLRQHGRSTAIRAPRRWRGGTPSRRRGHKRGGGPPYLGERGEPPFMPAWLRDLRVLCGEICCSGTRVFATMKSCLGLLNMHDHTDDAPLSW
jgi:hypothetical protein